MPDFFASVFSNVRGADRFDIDSGFKMANAHVHNTDILPIRGLGISRSSERRP
jgi:hypothetical protein